MSTTTFPRSQLPLILANKAILIGVAILGWWLGGAQSTASYAALILAYSALTGAGLVLALWFPRLVGFLLGLGYVLDMAMVVILIVLSGGFASPFWVLLALQAMLPAIYVPKPALVWFGAFATGPLYVLALWLQSDNLAFLFDPIFIARFLLLLLAAVMGAFASEHVHLLQFRVQELQQTLATREKDLDTQTTRLQRTAADLGDRVLQLRSLQEVARALAATLDLPETLQVLMDRLAALADTHHAAIALIEEDGDVLRGTAAAGPGAAAIRQFRLNLASRPEDARILATGRMVSSDESDLLGFDQLRALWQVEHFLCLPLVLRGRPLGAIYLADTRADFDNDRQRQLLDSFSYFAAAAIENARLYQAVADKSHELETILAGIGDGVLVVDSDLQLVLMNPAAVHIFGLEAAPPAGLPAQMIIDNKGLLDLLAEVTASPAEALFREIEIRQLGTGRAAVFQALAAPLVVGEGLQGIATVLRDVTTQKELERMKSNFLSVVSHELKTPLHSIKGFVDIILMGKTGIVSEIQRDFLETVKQQTDHLQRMIDDLLEFSRLESGRVTLRLQPTDISVVIEAAIDKLTPLAASAEVTLVNYVSEDLPALLADPWRLEQVVTNLVDNAIKFTPAGGTVTVTASNTSEFIQVNVRDTGIGVPTSESERIFDRFYQVDGGVNRLYKGTGLGLTICRHIVEHHGGRIWVQSDQDTGATFAFTISRNLQASDVGALDFTTLPQEKLLDN